MNDRHAKRKEKAVSVPRQPFTAFETFIHAKLNENPIAGTAIFGGVEGGGELIKFAMAQKRDFDRMDRSSLKKYTDLAVEAKNKYKAEVSKRRDGIALQEMSKRRKVKNSPLYIHHPPPTPP
jgi:hypothetical protein